MADEPRITRYRKRFKFLENEVNSDWKDTWLELQKYTLPRKGRYLHGNQEVKKKKGKTKDQNIVNNTALQAAQTLAAGMMSGLTSPTRPWFLLGLPDDELMELEPVKQWLHDVRNILLAIFAGSNFYNCVQSVYKELGVFGVGALFIEEDLTDVIKCRAFTIGEYLLANGEKNRPDVLYRQYNDTARNIVHKFGIDNVSESIRSAFKNNSVEQEFEVRHAIQPRGDFDATKGDQRGMRFESNYFEANTAGADKFLRESGFREQPFAVARWDVTGTEVYADGPGWIALSDNKMLQKMEKEKLKMLSKAVDPPLNAPVEMRNKGVAQFPGAVNYVDPTKGNPGATPIHQVSPSFQGLTEEIERVEDRINSSFFKNLLLGIMDISKRMTATEVVQRDTEALKILGPVIDRLISEFLDVIVERVYRIAERLNLIPEAPQELEGLNLKIEYISLLAQAQKAIGTNTIEQTAQFVANMAATFPSVVDKFDADEAVDQFGNLIGVPPKLIVPDEEVAAIRQERAQAAQKAQQQEQLAQLVEGAKTMSETKLGDDNLLAATQEAPV